MERIRGPFQGVLNIIWFNWHFFVLAAAFIAGLLGVSTVVSGPVSVWLTIVAALITVSVVVSLLTSFYVYDRSGLYTLSWLNAVVPNQPQDIVTINAGFDETSLLLHRKFPSTRLHVFDFYDARLHTEVSIRRARRAYPPYPGTKTIQTTDVPLADNTADLIFLMLSAHEIRQDTERVQFFTELHRVLRPAGQLVVVEHVRDWVNFLAYNVGFLHFLSRSTWLTTFGRAGFRIDQLKKITPFITVFILKKDDFPA